MTIGPNQILAMSDDELQVWALSGDAGSYVHEIGRTAMDMRCSLRMAEASDRTTAITVGLVQQTRNLAIATWGIVLITLLGGRLPAVFLASEDSGWITGELIHVNGGAYMA